MDNFMITLSIITFVIILILIIRKICKKNIFHKREIPNMTFVGKAHDKCKEEQYYIDCDFSGRSDWDRQGQVRHVCIVCGKKAWLGEDNVWRDKFDPNMDISRPWKIIIKEDM